MAHLTDVNSRTWLKDQGIDPNGDLCRTINTELGSETKVTVTAMCMASFHGELGVCQWLAAKGAITTIRVKDSRGCTPMFQACSNGHLDVAMWLNGVGAAEDIRTKMCEGLTPMLKACMEGHLHVAKWLFEAGAAEDIRDKDNSGHTPMLAACSNGYLDVAKWLFEVGAAEDIRTKCKYYDVPPMHYACLRDHLDVATWLYEVGASDDIRYENSMGYILECYDDMSEPTILWLVLHGAAHDEARGHVDASLVKCMVYRMDFQGIINYPFRQTLDALLGEHLTFTRLVLPAVMTTLDVPPAATSSDAACYAAAGPPGLNAQSSKKPLAAQPTPPLTLLCGHEKTLLALIADYVGVVRGRQLRNAREVHGILAREMERARAQEALDAARKELEAVKAVFAKVQARLVDCEAAHTRAEAEVTQANEALLSSVPLD